MKESIESTAFNNVLALMMVIGFFAVVFIMLFHEIPQGSKDMLGPIIGGIIGASVSTIIQYKWGSSAGSAAKSNTIAGQMTGTGDGTGTVSTREKTISSEKIVEKTVPALALWTVATSYRIGDIVNAGTNKYKAIAANTTSAENQPDTGANWREFWEVQA